VGIAELDYASIPFNDDPVADMSWMWQYCSEYGFYQRGDPSNPKNIETSFLSLDLFQDQCNQTFGIGLPTSPQVEHVNKYGGWNMQPSNTMWTNGECEYNFTRIPNSNLIKPVFLPSRPMADHGCRINRIQ
jgi:hypothetical protein